MYSFGTQALAQAHVVAVVPLGRPGFFSGELQRESALRQAVIVSAPIDTGPASHQPSSPRSTNSSPHCQSPVATLPSPHPQASSVPLHSPQSDDGLNHCTSLAGPAARRCSPYRVKSAHSTMSSIPLAQQPLPQMPARGVPGNMSFPPSHRRGSSHAMPGAIRRIRQACTQCR